MTAAKAAQVAPDLLTRLAAALAPGAIVEAGAGQAAVDADALTLAALLARRGTADRTGGGLRDRIGDDTEECEGAGAFACGAFERRAFEPDAGAAGATLRLWTNRCCLVVPRSFAQRERFAAAAAASDAAGWPVFLRASGGSAVVHRPGILNISLFAVRRAGTIDIAEAYRMLGARIVAALDVLGVPATLGAVPGSYCDGRFNIVAGGRKLAGTACLLRPVGARIGMLAHAMLAVTGDVAADVVAVARFEAAMGLAPAYDACAHVALAELIDARVGAGADTGGWQRPEAAPSGRR